MNELETTAPADRSRSTQYVWYVVFLLSLVNVFNYMDRMALAVLLPAIKADLVLSDGQLGLLIGLAFSLFYAVCGIPIARWADRGIRRDIIALALTTWSVMTALAGAAQNFWQLFVTRLGVGAGEAGCLPPAQSILCDYVPVQRRAGIFALHTFGLFVGMMLGMGLAGWLVGIIGWRWTFVSIGLPGIALAVIVKLTLHEPPREVVNASHDEAAQLPFGRTLVLLWRCRTYRMILLLTVLNGFVQYGLNQWWPSFYTRVFGLGMSSVGAYLGIALAGGSGAGLLLGGLIANKTARRDARLPFKIGAAATALALPTALASLFVPSAPVSLALVSLTGFFWSVSNGPAGAALVSVVASRMRATATAVSILFTAVLGFGLGPLCVGMLSDLLAPALGKEALRYAFLLPISIIPAMALVLYSAARTLPADLNAASGIFSWE